MFYALGNRLGLLFPFSSIAKTLNILETFLLIGKHKDRYALFLTVSCWFWLTAEMTVYSYSSC